MATRQAIETVEKIVNQAGASADIGVAPLSGFDGEGWLWKWRDRSLENRIAEVHLRVLSDVLTGDLETELFTYAELTVEPHTCRRSNVSSSRDVSWILTKATRESSAFEESVHILSNQLLNSWEQAHKDAELLEEYESRQQELRQKIHDVMDQSRYNEPSRYL